MHRHRLRRLFAILFAAVFFSASMLQVVPAAAMPMSAAMPMAADIMPMAAHDAAADNAATPCKGMTPACMTDLGCVFMIGVSVPVSQSAVRLSWLPVTYQRSQAAIAGGRARAPDLRPPIRAI